jgi:hypothetical protein
MEVKFWIYIVIGAIYFLSRLLKKKSDSGEAQPDPGRKRTPETSPVGTVRPKPLTFEELLREITEGKQPQEPTFRPSPQPAYKTFDDDLTDEARSLEEVNVDETQSSRPFKSYDEAARPIFRSSLEDTLQLKDTVMEFGKFKVFQEQRKRNLSDDYFKIFRNPGGLKQAVVMSEILKRKF